MLKSIDDGRPSLEIEVRLDRDQRLVTLAMLEFDHDLVADFVQREIPAEFHVRLDDSLFEHTLTLPKFDLFIELAGQRFAARLQHLTNGRMTLRLVGNGAAALHALYRLADYPVLASLARTRTDATHLDGRACLEIYKAGLGDIDHLGLTSAERAFMARLGLLV